MKSINLGLALGAFTLAICLEPSVGWSTHALGGMVSGAVTAAPQSGEIEIANHVYRIKADSPADKASSSFYAGQNVDVLLDGPANSSDSQVISITVHKE